MNCQPIIKPAGIKKRKKILLPFLFSFLFIFFFLIDMKEVEAATVTWDGSASTDWATAANWDTNSVPLSTDDVIINGSYTNAPTLDLNSGSVTVNSLSLGSSAASTLTISNGTSTPTAKKLIVTANATVGANGTITHTANSSSQTHSLVVDVGGDLTVTSGGSISANGKGYGGGGGGANGYGPGGGVGASSFTAAGSGGAGYGGNGGSGITSVGGTTYPALNQPVNLGSGGGGAYNSCFNGNGLGGNGGGSVKLNVSGTLTINGLITTNGTNGTSGGSGSPCSGYYYSSGGGSGGSVYLIAGIITGTTGSITSNGGNGGNNYGGAGGGGRIAIYYTTDSSTITKQAYGGSTGYQNGGAGTMFTKASSATNGDLTIDNNNISGATTPQVGNVTVDNITIKNSASYVVPSGTTLTVVANFTNGTSNGSLTNNGTIGLPSGAANLSGAPTITNNGAINNAAATFTIGVNFTNNGVINTVTNLTATSTASNTATTFYQNGTITSLTDLTIGSGATWEVQTASTTVLSLTTLTVKSGGTLTHKANTTTHQYGLNISATTVTVDSGGSINVNGKGYAGGGGGANGYGPGGGVGASSFTAAGSGGAGYGGNGGSGITSVGGTTYPALNQPVNLGSGGGGAYNSCFNGNGLGGNGGGSVKLNVSGTLTINGLITTNGTNGTSGGSGSPCSGYYYSSGGGSGGSVYLIAGIITGTTGSITSNGGNGGNNYGGGGSGGRIAIYYTTDSSSVTKQTTGGTGYQNGGAGTMFTKASSATNGDLTIDNNNISGTTTPQVGNVTVDYITIKNSASYVVPSGTTLTVATEFKPGTSNASFTNSGTLNIPATTNISTFSSFTNNGTLGATTSLTLSSITTFTNNGTINPGSNNATWTLNAGSFTNNGVINTVTNLTATSTASNAATAFYQANSLATAFPAGLANLTIGSGATWEVQTASTTVLSLTSLTVKPGGTLTHPANTTTHQYGLNISATTVTVDLGGSINVNGKGYAGGSSSGSSGSSGSGPGGGGIGYSSGYNYSGGGGGYGGYGGNGSYSGVSATGGSFYGSLTAPVNLGSGGGGGNGGAGGAGGGAIKLNVTGALTVNGSIATNGSTNGAATSGGGSGGSAYVIVGTTLSGTGSITANGGNGGNNYGGGGSGGRIAIYYTTDSSSVTKQTTGGTGYQNGGAGTIQTFDHLPYGVTSGTFTSSVIDLGAVKTFTTLGYNVTTYTGTTTITIDVRAGNTATPDGAWTSWQTSVNNGGDISALNGNRYVQYRVNLSTNDVAYSPSLNDITFNYLGYSASAELTSSSYDTLDNGNVIGKIQWTETLLAGTDAKFQIRTAPNSAGSPGIWTSWLGPDGTSASYFTDPTGGEAIPGALADGSNDRWVQYKVFLTSTGVNTPTVSDVTLTYVVNASPEIQNVTAVQGSDGKVTISYEIRDTDTNTDTGSIGLVTPSFEYYNGTSWSSLSSGNLAAGDTSAKAVNQSTYTSYTATWTATSTTSVLYTAGAKIRVTVSDLQGANATANAQSANFTLDTKTPTSASILVKATTTPATVSLSVTDDSALQMKVGLNPDLSGASWETFAISKTITLATDPDTVYVRFKDGYGNETATISSDSQTTPTNVMVQDTSNMNISPAEYRLFLAWNVVDVPANGFGSYHVYRSADGTNWPLLSTVSSRALNYYTDATPSLNTTYYYRIATADSLGNISYLSATSTGAANGTQDGSEGGGGTSSTAPVISSVSSSNTTNQSSRITWTTDKLSNSAVGYCVAPCSDYATNQTTVSSYILSHSVALNGLSSNTTYNYKVFSTDINSNTASSSGYSLTTNSGPAISNVAVTNVSNVSASITWNTNVAASGYVIYSTTTPPSGGEGGWAAKNTSRTVNLVNLTGGAKYYFYVKSQDNDNNWAYDYNISGGQTNYYNFTTPLDVTAPVISNIASTTKRTSAVITWTTDEDATSKVIYGTTTSYGSETTLDSSLTTMRAISLSDLSPGTVYHFKTVSADAANNQATSSDYVLTTETLSITNVAAVTPSNTSATVTWTTSDNASSQVEYSTFADLSSGVSYPANPSDSTTGHSVSLSSLAEGTTYYYRAKSAASNIATTTSQIYQFTTGDGQAPAVSSMVAASIKDSSAVTSWSTDEPATTRVQYGTVSGSYTASTTLDSTLTRSHSASLTGLSFQTKYYYRVLSTDGNGNATTSSESSFTTLEEQIGKSQQTITTTTIVSGGGGGSGSTGVPLNEHNNLKLELNVVKGERDDWKKKYDGLQDKVLGMGTTTDISSAEVISLVIDKFAEITESLTESALTVQNQDVEQARAQKARAEKLEKDIIPAVTSLRQLAKLVPPPKLKTEPKIEIKPTEAIVLWLTDKLATSVVYFSESKDYSEKTPDTYTNSAEDSKNYVTDHKIALKGLTPLTEYHYRLMSESEAGAKAYSTDFTFTTKPEMPKITQAKAEKSGDTSIMVAWRTNIPTNSAVVYTPVIAGKPDTKKSKSEGSPEFNQEHSIIIPRLEPSTVYNLEIASIDHFGNVVAEKLDPMSIAKDQTPPIITQVRNESSILSGASSNKVQAIFYWKTDEPSTTRIIFAKGPVAKDGEDGFDGKSNLNTELSVNHIAVVASWEPGEIYRFRAVSADAYGNESQSRTFTVVAPKQKATVVDLIIDNFSETFDWTKKLGR